MKRKLAGLYLTSTLIGNDINPFDARGLGAMSLSEHEFCNAFLKLMLHERKQVYSFAAEVLGHWLTATKKRNSYSGVVLEQGLRMQVRGSADYVGGCPHNTLPTVDSIEWPARVFEGRRTLCADS